MPRVVCAESKSPGMKAPQTRVGMCSKKRGISKCRALPANISRKNPKLPKTRGINKSWCLLPRALKARRAQGWITPQPRVARGAIKKGALITRCN